MAIGVGRLLSGCVVLAEARDQRGRNFFFNLVNALLELFSLPHDVSLKIRSNTLGGVWRRSSNFGAKIFHVLFVVKSWDLGEPSNLRLLVNVR